VDRIAGYCHPSPMPKPRPWTVASHEPLEPLAAGLWQVEADLDSLPIGRRMTIVRLADGDLVVHNAVACDDDTMAAIDALGPVRWLIVPSGYHRLDAHPFAERYPACKVLAPAGSAARVAQRVRVDGALDLLPADPSLAAESLDGVPAEAVLVHRAAGEVTLIFNDSFMNLPDRLPGFRGWVVKVIGSTGGPKVTNTAKWFIVKDRAAYAAHLRRLAATPGLARVVPGHGDVVRTEAAAALVRAADRLHRA
jgi:Domain of unknown function (DUF4336)